MFWQKKKPPQGPSAALPEKLPRPKDIPDAVGRYLVVNLGKDPDWVWQLKCARREQAEKNKFDVRIFDESQAAAKRANIKDYHSLDQHPDLILFQGWYDKKTQKVQVAAP